MPRRHFALTHSALAASFALIVTAQADGASREIPGSTRLACAATQDIRDIRLHIINEAGAAPEAIDAAMQEAREIWADAGVRLTFTFPPEPLQLTDEATILVMIRRALSPVTGKLATVNGKVRRPLGWLVFDGQGRPGRLIEVSFDAVTLLVMRGQYLDRPMKALPNIAQGSMLGRGMGRVIAHELGHWLMGRGHAEGGLMKRSFGTSDLTQLAPLRLPCDWPVVDQSTRR